MVHEIYVLYTVKFLHGIYRKRDYYHGADRCYTGASLRARKVDLWLPVLTTIVILLFVLGDVFKEYFMWRVEESFYRHYNIPAKDQSDR